MALDGRRIQHTFFVRNLAISPLGGIRIACHLKDSVGVQTPTRILPHFTLVYVLKGGGAYEDETGVRCNVGPGDAILVYPGLEHWYGPAGGGRWDEIYLVFEGPVFDLWRKEQCFDGVKPVVHLHPMEFWVDRIKQAIGENNEGDPSKMIDEAVRVQSLLAEIQHAARDNIEGDIIWLQSAKDALQEASSPLEAAAALGVAYEVFRKKFRKLSGMAPGKYRTALVMEQACHMLAESSGTLKSIAGELGYCDEYHFSKQFRKTIGWSPSEYRARLSVR